MSEIAKAFDHGKAFVAFITCGDPDLDTTGKVIREMAAAGADLFICEGMYGEPDKQEKAKEHKHMTFQEAALLAKKAQPKEMWLTHFSPAFNWPEEYIDEARKIFPASSCGKDGRQITLKFEEE